MADFDTQIKESQAQVAAAQAKISAHHRQDRSGPRQAGHARLQFDVENATLEDVHSHTDLMNANIAELIMGLDDVTAGFSPGIRRDAVEDRDGKLHRHLFLVPSPKSMRQERMRAASIDDKLQDLISKSDVIVRLLQGQLDLLNVQKTKVEANLGETLTEREDTVGALEAVRAEIAAMDPKIIELENKIAVEQDAAARTKLETELAALNARYNALVQDEQVQLAKSRRRWSAISKRARPGWIQLAESGGDPVGADQQAADGHQAAGGAV